MQRDTCKKVRGFMSKKTKHTNGAIGTVIKDFLPHPKELLLKDDSVKVTIWLSKESIEFFKG